ncbi:Vitamin B12 transporter BtuB precursor [Pseudomonas sp. THAF187a]|uniref:TonB-dependent receptor domain-containing protein n=1 Tax=unclassified Pseudomonas TaxID=196821 RepID=UPI001267B7ED|nr:MULTISPECIES: TonB-dependent receptor [unclassified Pseudomonas]QFT24005.1 Vitamin B12 transporter BtuB precursor [Pseudomonas sp. THAF187a]QFT44193.1 Vitamin B12 transporter BtuB precursor [Pseudomonas sp. THAF42]
MRASRLALAIAVLPGLSLASEPYVAEPLVITSGRMPEPQAQATAATTVFERADIERLQVSSVAELLQRVPGLSVVRTGGTGSQTGVFLRGTSTAQTLVLVDGQRIAAASSGTSSLEFLAPEQIERIEVVRGARSALYGSDAIGGVIQIFTRKGDDQGLAPYVRLAAGSDSTYQRSLGLSGGDQHTRFHLGAALDETAGIDATRDGFGANGDDDAYRNRSLSLSLSHRFDDSLQIGFNLLDQRGQVEYDDVFSGSLPTTDYLLSSVSGFIDAQLSDGWSSRLELGHSEDKRDSGNDQPGGSVSQFNTYRDAANWLNTLTLTENHQLLLGLDWYEDRAQGTTDFVEDSRWNRAAFIQHRYSGENFSTEIGLRHDDNQQFGHENTWNAALTLPLGNANDLILSYSEGFRAPTFNDLYYPDFCFGSMCFPSANPELTPERSRSYELQWRSRYSDTGSLQASVYRTEIEDAIVLDENFIPQNVQTARINGFEASVQQELFGWQGNLALSLIDPRDRDSGHTLQRRAKRTLTLDIDRRFGDVSIGAGWRALSGRYDDAENQIRMSGYGLLSLRAAWQATQELGLSLKLDNLLDRDYAEATYSTPNGRFGYNSAGRTALFAVTWTPQI